MPQCTKERNRKIELKCKKQYPLSLFGFPVVTILEFSAPYHLIHSVAFQIETCFTCPKNSTLHLNFCCVAWKMV